MINQWTKIRVPKAIGDKRMELKKKGLKSWSSKSAKLKKPHTSGLSSPEQDKGSSTPPRPTSGIKVLQPPIRSVSPRTRMGLKSNQDQRESKCLLTSNLSTGVNSRGRRRAELKSYRVERRFRWAVKTLFLVNDDGAAHEEDDKEQEENDDHNDDDDDDDGGSIPVFSAFESDPDHQSALRKL